jgi:hypothetical protein
VIKPREADTDGLPPGRRRLTSPYDTDTRWGVKRDLFWNGYKVHVSETCAEATPGDGERPDEQQPPDIITSIATTDASVPDSATTTPIHEALARRGLLPDEHLLDSGYPSGDLLVESAARYGIALVTRCSPMSADKPAPGLVHHALQQARARQDTKRFKATYTLRAGVEGTRQAVAVTDTRHARYRGLAKTRLYLRHLHPDRRQLDRVRERLLQPGLPRPPPARPASPLGGDPGRSAYPQHRHAGHRPRPRRGWLGHHHADRPSREPGNSQQPLGSSRALAGRVGPHLDQVAHTGFWAIAGWLCSRPPARCCWVHARPERRS